MRTLYILLTSILVLLGSVPLQAQFPASCDGDKSCIGNALTISVTSGKGAQYVDVDTSSVLRGLDTAITFEAWIRPEPQPGKRQFIGGLWGPNKDNNDQWVLYLEDERISFALSPDDSYLGDADNTVTSAVVPGLYGRGWIHVAAVWDGASTAARIYVDGFEVSRAANAAVPLLRLKRVESPKLPMQIGSCNGLYDDTTRYRTFKGQIDEVRLWRRALAEREIRCQRNLSLNGNEPGLILYYRCNEQGSSQSLCDATGNAQVGLMRSGAACNASDRQILPTYIVTPGSVGGTLYCTSDTVLSFTIVDTSFCGSTVQIQMAGADGRLFRASQSSFTLAQNVPQTFTVQLRATLIGAINAEMRVVNTNRCGATVRVPLVYTRRTELDYSKGRMQLDTLFVGCLDKSRAEDTLEICNNTGRPMNLDSLVLGTARFNWRALNPARTPFPGAPVTLASGECWKVIVRMDAGDTTRTNYDTLRIFSDDRCPGSGIIPVQGHSQEVFTILQPNGVDRVDSMNFGDVCPGQISDVQMYQWRNLLQEPIDIDTIIVSNGFFTRRNIYPVQLLPRTAYQPTFTRFRPDRPGPFTGQMIFRTTYRGCVIERKVELTGRGISVDVSFNGALVGFGNVTIGKTQGQGVSVTNNGRDARGMAAYLKVGDVFSIVSGGAFAISPGQTVQVGVEFRPREPRTYYDTLCVFDNQCYQTICIPISGTGVFDALVFDPPYLNMENIIGCQCRTDTIQVLNNLGSGLGFTWTKNDPGGKFQVRQLGSAGGALPVGGGTSFEVTYCPNDLNTDRSDRSYIDIRLSDGQLYQVLLHGTSVAPKLYVTPLTAFGNVEAGWRRREMILVENASSVPIHVTAANVPPGYTVLSTSPVLPRTLNPRDSLWVEVELAPTTEGSYNGRITLVSDSPCQLGWSGELTGRGVVMKLDVPIRFINYGLIKPCDCSVREIPLPNNSEYIPMDIDSVWIDGAGVTSANPAVFVWRSRQTGGATLPYTLAPRSVDTLLVSFCPNIPATQQNLLANAAIHIRARTQVWSEQFDVVLSGRREMNFQPNRVQVSFPATRVDTAAQPIPVEITVPDQFINPSGDSVVIDTMTFVPDQRVFSIEHPSGQPFPWVIKRGEKLTFRVKFYPRAPKDYVARLNIHTSFPCTGVDTTILVRGTGFAPAFGLQMAFDTSAVGRDTINLTTCDTLELPVMITRAIPQDIIDIAFRIGYDSTAMKLIGVRSPYTGNSVVRDTGDGARAYLKDARMVQAGTVAYVRFAVTRGPVTFPITLDEIDFDSDSLVFFKIIAGIDRGLVRIDQPMIEITRSVRFDTVNIKSCDTRAIVVRNPGLIPITFDSLSGLPPGHRITASSIPYPAVLAPGDSIELTLTFCPFMEMAYDSTLRAHSSSPCVIADSGTIHSFGYAPPFPMRIMLGDGTTELPSISGIIADTVEVPVSVDRDVPQTPLDVTVLLEYNRRALQFIDARSSYSAAVSASESSNGLLVRIPGCDSIRQGEIALLRFVVAVPDVVSSPMYLIPQPFTSDSIFWVKLDPPITTGDTTTVMVDPRCNISRLNFRGGTNKLSAARPNPARTRISIEAEFVEDANTRLRLYNSAGVEVYQVLDGSTRMSGGRYRFDFDVSVLPSGDYYCVLEAGRFRAVEQVKIVK